jgi:hypothetical protein
MPKILAPAVGSCERILHRSQIELKEENFEISKFSWGVGCLTPGLAVANQVAIFGARLKHQTDKRRVTNHNNNRAP